MQRICSAAILAIEVNAAATIGYFGIRSGFEFRSRNTVQRFRTIREFNPWNLAWAPRAALYC